MLTSAWTQHEYHPIQRALWTSRARFVAVCAGRGSGKTEIARRRIVRYLPVRKPWPRPIYVYALPTYAQAKRLAWEQLIDLIPKDWLAREPHQTDLRIDCKSGARLYVVGMDKPQRIEGDQIDGIVIDESSDQRPGVFARTVLPMLTHRSAWCWRIGVPKRTGCGAIEFREFFELGQKGLCVPGTDARIQSFTWSSADILRDDDPTLQFARMSQSGKDFDEQFGGMWQDAEGLIFYEFSDANISERAQYNTSAPLCIGSDFNVDPMAWVVAHVYGNTVHVFDELWLRNTSTQRALDELHKRYGEHQSGFRFFGDATGRARRSSASTAAQSDYAQIRADARFTNSRVSYPDSNPAVVDRFAVCNAMLRNAAGDMRLTIHPRCTNLIRDLKSRAYVEGTREPDDFGDVGHITDALGYLVHRLFPIRAYAQGAQEIGSWNHGR